METLLLPILLFAAFYFILIRPQQKQRREIARVQSTLAPGTKVMTGSGLIATIVAVDDDEVVLEVSPGVTNRYVRRAIMRVVPDPTEAADTDEPGSEDGLTGGVAKPVTDDIASQPVTDRTNRNDGPGTSP
jgi:preprotein translocase subunit YajC